MQTPSTHRQRLPSRSFVPTTRMGTANMHANNPSPLRRGNATNRSPLANLNGNIGFAGYGMSAGLKVSNTTDTPNDVFPRSVVRSRCMSFHYARKHNLLTLLLAAQQPSPTPGFPPNRSSVFRGRMSQNMFSNGDRFYWYPTMLEIVFGWHPIFWNLNFDISWRVHIDLYYLYGFAIPTMLRTLIWQILTGA